MARSQLFSLPLLFFFASLFFAQAEDASSPRQAHLLNGSGWQFVGYEDATKPPDIGTGAFNQAAWTAVEVPHNFQTRAAYNTLTRGWYRRQVTVDPSAQGKELHLLFEGAVTLADVYVSGQHLPGLANVSGFQGAIWPRRLRGVSAAWKHGSQRATSSSIRRRNSSARAGS